MAQLVVVFAALCAFLTACGAALPQEPSSANLHRDLERLVELAGREGWSIDRLEVEENLPAALMSVCRTTEQTRGNLMQWLQAQIALHGGPIRQAYVKAGRDLDAVETLLVLTRVRLLLDRSIKSAAQDCPFWLEPKPFFGGKQILDDRWLLSVGGGGKGILMRHPGFWDFNFGGAGRVLVGKAFGRHATLLAGIETGGSAGFPKDSNGDRGEVTIAVDAALPLVYRHRLVNSYWEVETGYVGHAVEGEQDITHGFRVGVAFGGQSSRRRWVFPGAAFGISYERFLTDASLHVIKMGFRVAIDMTR